MIQPQFPYAKNLKLEDFTEQSQIIAKDYICPLCEGVYLDPSIDLCGHISCEKCLQCFDSTLTKCPFTNQSLPSRPTKVKVMAAIIDKQTMYCPNKKKGCNWEGQVKEFQKHILNDCIKQFIKCSMEGCNVEVLPEEFETHLKDCNYRSIQCKYCNDSYSLIQLDNHYQSCPKYLVACPQKCTIKIQREALSDHLDNECDFTEVNCCYHEIGCQKSCPRKDLNKHKTENYNEHLDLIFQSIYKQNKEATEKFKSLENSLLSLASVTKKSDKDKEVPNVITNKVEIGFIGAKRGREEDKDLFKSQTNNNMKINKKLTEVKSSPIELRANYIPSEPIPSNSAHSFFDLKHQPPGIAFKGNKAKNMSHNIQHKILFLKPPFDLKKEVCHWKIKILSASSWIGLGLCDKEIIISNKYKFDLTRPQVAHGLFIIQTNGYVLNSNKSSENSIQIKFPPVFLNDVIEFLYQPDKQELMFQLNTCRSKLSNVEGKELACCIIFLNYGNEVEILYDS